MANTAGAQVTRVRPGQPRRGPATVTPRVAIRAFGFVTAEQFAAKTSFDALFNSRVQQFFGGGAELVFRNGLFADVAVSHWAKTGERAFVLDGQTYRLGQPLDVRLIPVEVSAGYRFKTGRRFFPHLGGGAGWYSYREQSAFAESGENVNTQHVGGLVDGGLEYRVHRLVGVDVDVQRSFVPGILGTGGISKQAGESDLGGLSARFRILVGR